MSIRRSCKKVAVDLLIVDLKFVLPDIYIDRQTKLEVNRTILAPEKPQNGHISIRVFSKVSVTQSLVTSATINAFP